jgi:hypothetical protein
MQLPVPTVEGAAMKMQKLAALRAWQLLLVLLGVGAATALAVWAFVWVLWTIRPFVAAAAAVSTVGWALYSLHRYRRSRDWSDEEWIGS